MEELRLQSLRIREETEQLEGPFNKGARQSSQDRQKRSDAEAARRVAAGTAATGAEESWVNVATARGRRDRPRSPSRPAKGRGKTKDKDRDVSPTIGGLLDPVSDDDDTVDRLQGAAKGATKGRGKGGWAPSVDRLGRLMLGTGAAQCSSCLRALGQGRISAVAISR